MEAVEAPIFEDWYEDHYDGNQPYSKSEDLLGEYFEWCKKNGFEPVV